jgi:Rap1a immunity proteins
VSPDKAEGMKNAMIVLLVVIDAGLGILAYIQESSDPPATATYSLQGEFARDASTGNDIQIWCESERLTARAYTAQVWGKHEYSRFVDAAALREKDSLVGYCEPAELTVQQVTDLYCKFLEDNPEKRSMPGGLLFTEAMRRAWPCDPH